MKNNKKIFGFTLIEIMIGIMIVSFVMIGGFKAMSAITIGKARLIQQTDIQKESFYFTQKFFETIKKGGTIDYEEYFNRKVIGNITFSSGHFDIPSGFGNFGSGGVVGTSNFGSGFYYCRSGVGVNNILGKSGCFDNYLNNYGEIIKGKQQRYGQYSFQFIDYNSNFDFDLGDEDLDDSIIGDIDDEYIGDGPVAFSGGVDLTELYLISGDRKERTVFRWNITKDKDSPESATCNIDYNTNIITGSGCIGNIEYLKLDGLDMGMEHSGTKFDGVIDTWFIDKDFTGGDNIVAGSGAINWISLFPNTINVSEFKIFAYPNKDIKYSWQSNDINISPYIILKLKLKPSWISRKKIGGEGKELDFSMTINLTDIYSKTIGTNINNINFASSAMFSEKIEPVTVIDIKDAYMGTNSVAAKKTGKAEIGSGGPQIWWDGSTYWIDESGEIVGEFAEADSLRELYVGTNSNSAISTGYAVVNNDLLIRDSSNLVWKFDIDDSIANWYVVINSIKEAFYDSTSKYLEYIQIDPDYYWWDRVNEDWYDCTDTCTATGNIVEWYDDIGSLRELYNPNPSLSFQYAKVENEYLALSGSTDWYFMDYSGDNVLLAEWYKIINSIRELYVNDEADDLGYAKVDDAYLALSGSTDWYNCTDSGCSDTGSLVNWFVSATSLEEAYSGSTDKTLGYVKVDTDYYWWDSSTYFYNCIDSTCNSTGSIKRYLDINNNVSDVIDWTLFYTPEDINVTLTGILSFSGSEYNSNISMFYLPDDYSDLDEFPNTQTGPDGYTGSVSNKDYFFAYSGSSYTGTTTVYYDLDILVDYTDSYEAYSGSRVYDGDSYKFYHIFRKNTSQVCDDDGYTLSGTTECEASLPF